MFEVQSTDVTTRFKVDPPVRATTIDDRDVMVEVFTVEDTTVGTEHFRTVRAEGPFVLKTGRTAKTSRKHVLTEGEDRRLIEMTCFFNFAPAPPDADLPTPRPYEKSQCVCGAVAVYVATDEIWRHVEPKTHKAEVPGYKETP